MSHDYHMTRDSCLLQIYSPVEFVYVLYFIGEVCMFYWCSECSFGYILCVCIWRDELHTIHLSVVDPQRFVMKWRCTMGCQKTDLKIWICYISRQT